MKYKVLDTYGVVAKNAEFKKTERKTFFLEPDWRSLVQYKSLDTKRVAT